MNLFKNLYRRAVDALTPKATQDIPVDVTVAKQEPLKAKPETLVVGNRAYRRQAARVLWSRRKAYFKSQGAATFQEFWRRCQGIPNLPVHSWVD